MLASDLPTWLARAFAFVFGSLWGSFFNVAIYRWPREMSVVNPPSHCPSCGAPVPPWRNVPIVGYLVLRGRAACCGAKLSPRYVLVEILGGVLCAAVAERLVVHAPEGEPLLPAMLETLVYFAFAGGLLVATFVDFEWMEIPDEVTLPGAALGLLTVELRDSPGAVDAALGAGLGFLSVQVLFVWLYEALFGRRGMGEGDSKLLLMIGAFLGWRGVVFAIVAGSLQGLVAAGISLALGRELTPTRPDEAGTGPAAPDDEAASGAPPSATQPDAEAPADAATAADAATPPAPDDPEGDAGIGRLKMPYGPFLSLAAVEFLFFGPEIVESYERFVYGLAGH